MEKVEFLMEDCLTVANLNAKQNMHLRNLKFNYHGLNYTANLNAKQNMHLRNLKFNYHGLNYTATYTVKIMAACACTTVYLGLVRPYCSNELSNSSNRVSKASRLL